MFRRLIDILDAQLFRSGRARRRFLLHVTILAVAVVVAFVFLHRYVTFLFDVKEARSFVDSFGVWAPVVMVLLQALQVVLAPVPNQLLGAVGGYLFGPWLGTLYNVIGITIGSTVAFWLSRRFGRAYVEQIVDPETLSSFDEIDDRRALALVFAVFLVPGLPDDVICFGAGLTTVPLWQLIVVAVVGRAPSVLLANAFGDFLGTGDTTMGLFLLALGVFLAALGYHYRERLRALLTARR